MKYYVIVVINNRLANSHWFIFLNFYSDLLRFETLKTILKLNKIIKKNCQNF